MMEYLSPSKSALLAGHYTHEGVRCREVGEMNFQTRLLVVAALGRAVPFILVTSLVRGLAPFPRPRGRPRRR